MLHGVKYEGSESRHTKPKLVRAFQEELRFVLSLKLVVLLFIVACEMRQKRGDLRVNLEVAPPYIKLWSHRPIPLAESLC